MDEHHLEGCGWQSLVIQHPGRVSSRAELCHPLVSPPLCPHTTGENEAAPSPTTVSRCLPLLPVPPGKEKRERNKVQGSPASQLAPVLAPSVAILRLASMPTPPISGTGLLICTGGSREIKQSLSHKWTAAHFWVRLKCPICTGSRRRRFLREVMSRQNRHLTLWGDAPRGHVRS